MCVALSRYNSYEHRSDLSTETHHSSAAQRTGAICERAIIFRSFRCIIHRATCCQFGSLSIPFAGDRGRLLRGLKNFGRSTSFVVSLGVAKARYWRPLANAVHLDRCLLSRDADNTDISVRRDHATGLMNDPADEALATDQTVTTTVPAGSPRRFGRHKTGRLSFKQFNI